MSEVQRFWSHEASNIRCVREADFDRVQAELERTKRYMEINADSAQGKHLEGLRYRDERNALQELLNQRDEAIHDLEQRRHAEQQACQAAEQDAARYRWLRGRNLETIHQGGVFAGITPENMVLNGVDLDAAVDAAIEAALNSIKP